MEPSLLFSARGPTQVAAGRAKAHGDIFYRILHWLDLAHHVCSSSNLLVPTIVAKDGRDMVGKSIHQEAIAYIRAIIVRLQVESNGCDPVRRIVRQRGIAAKVDAGWLTTTAFRILCCSVPASAIADPACGIPEDVFELIRCLHGTAYVVVRLK